MSTEPYDGTDIEDQADKINDDAELIARIRKNISNGEKHLGQWRMDAEADFDNYAGNQWDEKDKLKLDQEGRPAIVFNRQLRIVNAICGLEVQNRQEVRLFPRRTNGSGLADSGNDAFKWVRDNCDAEDQDSEAFRDAVICGLGFTEIYMDYETNPEGDIKIKRRDPLDMIYDFSATEKNIADKKWVCHKIYMSRDEIKEKWGDDILDNVFSNGISGDDRVNNDVIIDRPGNQYAVGDRDDERDRKGKIPVYHYQEYTLGCLYKVINPFSEQIETLSEDDFEKIKNNPLFENIKSVKIPSRNYMRYFIIGSVIVERSPLTCNDFTFNVITGFYDRNSNTYFGVCKIMRDPQMWSNKFFSQILHIINTNAKGGLLAEEGAFQDPQRAINEWARPDAITILNPGGLQKIQPKIAPEYPSGLDRLMQYAQSSINDVTGVSLEFLGQANRDQPYVLEYQRQKQGTLILAPLFDSNRRYRKIQGRLLYKYIQEYISDGRLIRVLGQDEAQYIRLLRDNMALEYDVVVDDAPTSPNVKERVFEVLMQMIPMALQAGIPIPPDVLDFAPLPESLTTKWKQRINYVDPMQEQMKQMQAVMMQLQADKQDLENRKTSAEINQVLSTIPLNSSKAQQAQASANDINALAAQRMSDNMSEVNLMQQKFQYEQALKEVEMMLENQRNLAQMHIDAHMDNQRMQNEIQLKAQQQMMQPQQQSTPIQ